MAWLSRNSFIPSDALHSDDLNNLANDDRTWGGNVNGGGYTLSNVVISTAATGAVPNTRQINSGVGLTGGGDLTVDRTLSVVDDTSIQRLRVNSSGTLAGTRPGLNFVTGANITIAAADDSVNNRVNVTVTATGFLTDPTTTKGDLVVRGGAAPATRFPVGTNGQVLTADSAQTLGVKWATPAVQTPWTSNINAAGFQLTGTGNVGVGTAAPRSQLSVIPATTPTTVAGANQITIGESTNNSQNQLALGFGNVGASNVGVIQALAAAAGGALLLNPSGGNVGIGTATLRGTLSITAAVNPTTVSNATQIVIGEVTNTSGYGLTIGYLFDAGTLWKGAIQNYHGGAGNALLLNPLGGNVAIGTVTPTSRLHIIGLSVYASDAAAGSAGLTGGAVYLDSTGVLHIKL